MKLTDEDRMTIELLSRRAAKRHFQEKNPNSTEDQAERFAARHWRQFDQVGIEIFALWTAIDEADAAERN